MPGDERPAGELEATRELLDAAEERARLSQALNAVDASIHSTLQFEEVMQRSLAEGIRALECDAGAIEIRDGYSWIVRYQYGFSEDDVGMRLGVADAPNANRAARTLTAFAIDDIAHDPSVNVGFPKKYGLKSVLVVPLFARENVFGCILFYTSSAPRHFTEGEIQFGRRLGLSVSLALENARLLESEREAQELATQELRSSQVLLEAARVLSTKLDLVEALAALAELTLRSTGLSRAFVNLIDMDRLVLTPMVATAGLVAPTQGGAIEFNRLSSTSLQAILAHKTAVLDYERPDISEYDQHIAEANHVRRVLFVPLLLGDRILGEITIDEPGKRHKFTPREIELVQGIASQAAVVVRNAQLYEAEQERARLAEQLAEIDAQLHSALDIDEMMRLAVAGGAEALGADSGALTLYRDHAFTVQHSFGFDEDITGLVIAEETERHSLIALKTRQPVMVQDVSTDSRVDADHLRSFGVGAVAAVPLVVGGEPIGNLYYNFAQKRYFTDREVDFVQRIGASMSLAMENARLLETERATARVNEALARIDQSIHATLERDVILQRVAVESATAIGADGTVLALREGDEWVVRYAYNMPGELIGAGFTVEQAPFMLIAVESGEPVAIDDAFHDPRAVRETQELLGTKAVIMTAIIVREEAVGGLFFNYWDVHHFTDNDVDYARRLAASVGLAMANVRLYEAEHAIADRLQGALLALPARLPGVEFAHAYHSATETARVGGDFYDIFEIAPGRIGITMGDVAGKGLDAAVLTSLAKHTIRAHAMEQGKTPARVLELTNDVVYHATPTEVFVTIFFGVLDCSTGTLEYASAGHTTTALARDDRSIEPLAATGPLLGAFSPVRFQQVEVVMAPDDLLFLYTDGLIEARQDAVPFGEKRLFSELGAREGDEPVEVVAEIVESVISHSGNQLKDDLALLVVRRSVVDGRTAETDADA